MAKKEIALVTGCDSFIGKHLCDQLRSRNVEVIGLGRNDMTDREGYYLPEHIDYIFNLAAAGSKRGYYSDWDMFWTNVHQTFELLQETRDIPYRAFIQFGTSSEYGIKELPMREDDVLRPDFMYAATKAAATQLCRAFAIENNKPVVNVRPFSVYGEGMQNTKFIPVLFEAAKSGKEVNLVDGNHDYIYIDDFLNGLELVVENSELLKGESVNLGSGKQHSNKEVLIWVSDITGKPIKYKEVQTVKGNSHVAVDSPTWQANINLMKTLNWKPRINLREGLERMYVKE